MQINILSYILTITSHKGPTCKTQAWWYIKENTYISVTLILAILGFLINSNNTWWSYISVYHKQHSPFPADPEP